MPLEFACSQPMETQFFTVDELVHEALSVRFRIDWKGYLLEACTDVKRQFQSL